MTKAISNQVVTRGVGPIKMVTADINITSYTASGEPLTAANLGMNKILSLMPDMNENYGYNVSYDYTNGLLKVFSPTGSTVITGEAINVADDDNAASTGVALYLHTKDGRVGWLEFVSPTDADGTGTLNNGGSTFFVFDADGAATDGVVVYFDEDATNADERFLIVSPSGQDIFVPVAGSNQVIRLKHDASAASNGVQVYFDEDGTNTYERAMFVSPTDTVGAGACDDSFVLMATPITADVGNEVAATTDVGVIRAVVFGV